MNHLNLWPNYEENATSNDFLIVKTLVLVESKGLKENSEGDRCAHPLSTTSWDLWQDLIVIVTLSEFTFLIKICI